jgi:NAD(P)-dependent dehydrogenase (short-subunit alcohol dehydrogenase family)
MHIEPFEPRGANVLVTGSSSGIGAGLAVALAQRGAVVGICGRRDDRLRAVLEECQKSSPASHSWHLDLLDTGSLAGFAADVESQFGSIDLLVNNAGVPKRRLVTRLTPAEVQDVMTVNYLAPVLLTLAVLPGMLRRGHGRIVNVASTASRLGGAGETAYGASKAALAIWTEGSAAELLSQGIGVQLVIPGPVDTDIVNYPGEDPPLAARAGMTRLPLEEAVAVIVDHIVGTKFEVWLPPHFRDAYRRKVEDPDRSLIQAATWIRDNLLADEGSGPGPT